MTSLPGAETSTGLARPVTTSADRAGPPDRSLHRLTGTAIRPSKLHASYGPRSATILMVNSSAAAWLASRARRQAAVPSAMSPIQEGITAQSHHSQGIGAPGAVPRLVDVFANPSGFHRTGVNRSSMQRLRPSDLFAGGGQQVSASPIGRHRVLYCRRAASGSSLGQVTSSQRSA